MVDYGVFNILTPSNGILIVSYDLPESKKVLKKIFKKKFFPRVPPLHIFRNFGRFELVIVVLDSNQHQTFTNMLSRESTY